MELHLHNHLKNSAHSYRTFKGKVPKTVKRGELKNNCTARNGRGHAKNKHSRKWGSNIEKECKGNCCHRKSRDSGGDTRFKAKQTW